MMSAIPGDSFEVAIDHLNRQGMPRELRTCALQHKQTSRYVPDYFGAEITEWRWLSYPWAVLEDLGGFIVEAGVEEREPREIIELLHERHGFRATPRQVADALRMLKRGER